jgi:inhibitor of cysteine peptidase
MKTSQYLTGVIIMCIFIIYYLSDFCTLNPIHGINDYIDLTSIKYTKMNISFKEQTITAKVGEKFNIDIPSNPTTGYTWVVENDQQKLKLISRDMIMVDSKNLGSKGTERFIFEALSEGETSVYMKYKRPWENVSLSENIYKIQIIK